MPPSVRTVPFDGTRIAVLADCHIHDGGPQFPAALFDKLQGVDLIVTLGDMGEASGLDQLAAVAPVVGVRGQDDSDDPRTAAPVLRLTQGSLDIGCVFDPTAAGLATSSDPFVEAPDAAEVSRRLFGAHVDILLYASTHRAGSERFGPKGIALNPGSAVLPAEGAAASFLHLNVGDGAFAGELVTLA
jgi:putative phosphoesterase